MPQHARREPRRAQRRHPSYGGVAILALAVVLLAVGAVFWWYVHRPAGPDRAQAGSAQDTSRPAIRPAAVSKAAASQPSAISTSPSATQTEPPATLAAARASVSAAEKAAVPFPGAPAVSPTMRSVNHLNPRHKYIAITLDDGYNFQPKMLQLFQQYDVHCTTFLIGSWAATHKKELKLMKDAGFEIANHSWSHPFLTRLSSAAVASELTKTQRVITSVTGSQAPYLRPPFGATNPSVKTTAAGLGYRIVMWDRTFGDSGRGATPQKLYSNVMYANGGVKPGDIILCHWGSRPSFEALKRVLPDLRAQGYQCVTISELIADSQ
jgi:peptidoglycan/xylan/chitin deacetylase (PgdA/CDA1 family)